MFVTQSRYSYRVAQEIAKNICRCGGGGGGGGRYCIQIYLDGGGGGGIVYRYIMFGGGGGGYLRKIPVERWKT